MSADFSIRPVGASAATLVVAPVSEAAQKAVATELPAGQSVTAPDIIARAAINADVVNSSRTHQVFLDRDAASIVYQVVDERTSEVVKQYPDDSVLRLRAYFHALDLARETPTRSGLTDRRA